MNDFCFVHDSCFNHVSFVDLLLTIVSSCTLLLFFLTVILVSTMIPFFQP